MLLTAWDIQGPFHYPFLVWLIVNSKVFFLLFAIATGRKYLTFSSRQILISCVTLDNKNDNWIPFLFENRICAQFDFHLIWAEKEKKEDVHDLPY